MSTWPRWLAHLPFALVVLVGAAPRAVAMFAYQPVLFFFGDSYSYLLQAQTAVPSTTRPFGYAALLRLLAWTDQFWVIPVVQHLAAIGIGIALYVWLLRRGAPIWLATVVPAPFLVDGYQVAIEHLAVTETLFLVLLLAALLLIMRDTLTVGVAVSAGCLLAAAALTRTAGVPLIVLVVVYAVVRRAGPRAVVALVVAFSIPMVAYATWFSGTYGTFALQQDGRFLYARVAPFADCSRIAPAPALAVFCEGSDPAERRGPNFYAWSTASPFRSADVDDPLDRERLAREFALATIVAQPLDYAAAVLSDTGQYLLPGRVASRQDTPPRWWDFPDTPAGARSQTALSGTGFDGETVPVRLDEAGAAFTQGWQRSMGTQGPLLALGIVLGLLGAVRGRHRAGGVRPMDALLLTAVGVALLVIPSATSVFDYRYGLPAALMLYLAGGVGSLALLQARWERRPPLPITGVALPRRRGARAVRPGRWRAPAALGAVLLLALGVVLSPIVQPETYRSYVRATAERGLYGYPVSDEEPVEGRPDWIQRVFDGGRIMVSPAGQVFELRGPIGDAYARLGAGRGVGVPIETRRLARGPAAPIALVFERAILVSSPASGVVAVLPPFTTAWCGGDPPCDLGFPLGEATSDDDGTLVQEFSGGRLVLAANGAIEVREAP
jgi:hypothetical protein